MGKKGRKKAKNEKKPNKRKGRNIKKETRRDSKKIKYFKFSCGSNFFILKSLQKLLTKFFSPCTKLRIIGDYNILANYKCDI